jgi:hypothetical protein
MAPARYAEHKAQFMPQGAISSMLKCGVLQATDFLLLAVYEGADEFSSLNNDGN